MPVDEVEEVWHGLAAALRRACSPGWRAGPKAGGARSRAASARPCWPRRSTRRDFAKLDPADFAAEWKWDGIRVQAVARAAARARLYSRTGDDIAAHLSRPRRCARRIEGALDGELLVMRDGAVQSFNDLQQRLNRKTVDAKLLGEFPAHIRAYDLLVDGERGSARICRSASGASAWRPSSPPGQRRASTSRR